MNTQVVSVLLAVYFGQGTKHAAVVGKRRLLVSIAAALGVGTVIALALRKLQLPPGLSGLWQFSAVTITSLLITYMFFMMAGVLGVHTRTSVLQRLFVLLPLKPKERYLAQLFVPGFVAGVCLLALLPIAYALSQALGSNMFIQLAGVVFGVLCGLGMGLSALRMHSIWQTAVGIGFGMVGFMALRYSLIWTIRWYTDVPLYGLLGFCSLALLGYRLAYTRQLGSAPQTLRRSWLHLEGKWLKLLWFTPKLLRHQLSYGSYIFCQLVTLSMAAILLWRGGVTPSRVETLLLVVSSLILGFAADVRGTAQRSAKPELYQLKGVGYFVRSQMFAAIGIGLLIALPILVLLPFNTSPLIIASNLVAATMIGLLAGAIVVPAKGDGSGQFTALVIAAGLFYGLLKLTSLFDITGTIRSLSWLGAALGIYGLVLLIESRRRRSYVSTRTIN